MTDSADNNELGDAIGAEIDEIDAERRARVANSADLWDALWRAEGEDSWRERALSQVYTRIARLTPEGAGVIDVGGGVGQLACRLREERGAHVLLLEQSPVAVKQARAAGIDARESTIGDAVYRAALRSMAPPARILVATEVFEHLPSQWRAAFLADASLFVARGGTAFISVPNNRLGPDEEPQHTCKYTALALLEEARREMERTVVVEENMAVRFGGDAFRWARARTRVEALGPYLLLVLSSEPRTHTLSVCTPARDEAADLEAVLASFRGVADEIVVGVDPRTTDATREVARRYAEVVFELESPEGPPDAPLMSKREIEDGIAATELTDDEKEADFTHVRMPEGTGVNFAWIRNQCLDRCTSEWVFMTEAHERLISGEDVLLHLGEIVPKQARVGMVLRTGTGQQWGFPWLARRAPDIRYRRAVHNVLDFPAGTYVVQFPQIRTLHDRVHERTAARAEQRAVQNRTSLFRDWLDRKNEASLFYFASEMRDVAPRRAIEHMREFITVCRNGGHRYHARIIQAKELFRLAFDEFVPEDQRRQLLREAREVLILATGDDWTRAEHWLRLGDLAAYEEDWDQAHRFYSYAATFIGQPPFTSWWIDLSTYSYAPAQRLAWVCGELGRLDEALYWAIRVLRLLPDNAPLALEEARGNVRLLKEAIATWKQPPSTASPLSSTPSRSSEESSTSR